MRDLLIRIVAMMLFLLVISLIEYSLFSDLTSVNIGITTGVIAGVFVLIFQRSLLEQENNDQNLTEKIYPSMEPSEGQLNIKTEIRDILKDVRDNLRYTSIENRELTYSVLCLSAVVTIIGMITTGKDLVGPSYSILLLKIGWALIPSIVVFLYLEFKKCNKTLEIIIVLIVFVIIFMIGLLSPAPSPYSVGNITNIYENGSHPVINTINYNNYTILINTTCREKPPVSIAEMKYFLGSSNVHSVTRDK